MASAYDREQLGLFFDHIEFPHRFRHAPPTIEVLAALHTHVISKLPYENLSLHYNPTHEIDLDPQTLFQKIVLNKRGRGGFCMEVAILYNHVLRAMGFVAYTAGARTRLRTEGVPQGEFPGWGHIVNIVTLPDGTRYHSDVAFGGDGATLPMPLIAGVVHRNLGSQQIRLCREWLQHQVHRVEESKQWIYQYRNSQAVEWNTFYAFTETEFLQPDWGVVNFWMSKHPDSNQVKRLLIVKFLRRQKSGGMPFEQEIYGKRMLINQTVKQNLGGRTEILKVCETEEDRLRQMEDLFEITLLQEEKSAIRDTSLCLASA